VGSSLARPQRLRKQQRSARRKRKLRVAFELAIERKPSATRTSRESQKPTHSPINKSFRAHTPRYRTQPSADLRLTQPTYPNPKASAQTKQSKADTGGLWLDHSSFQQPPADPTLPLQHTCCHGRQHLEHPDQRHIDASTPRLRLRLPQRNKWPRYSIRWRPHRICTTTAAAALPTSHNRPHTTLATRTRC
jgi:hypothetical protein